MVRLAKDRLGRWFWPCCVALALASDYLLAGALLATPPTAWGGARRAYVDLAHLAGQGYMMVLLAAVLGLAGQATLRRRWLSAARWLVASVLLTGFWAQLIKHLVGRPRPRMWGLHEALLPIGPTIRASWDSFPSGHAMTVFAVAPLLEAVFPWMGRGWVVLAALIALGRVVGCDHYASDVVVGAVLGMAIGRYVRAAWQAEVETDREHV